MQALTLQHWLSKMVFNWQVERPASFYLICSNEFLYNLNHQIYFQVGIHYAEN